jgi:hypothetical protein
MSDIMSRTTTWIFTVIYFELFDTYFTYRMILCRVVLGWLWMGNLCAVAHDLHVSREEEIKRSLAPFLVGGVGGGLIIC